MISREEIINIFNAIKNAVEGTQDVQLKGVDMELWGADTSTRPDADAVDVGTIFIAINSGDHKACQSDGTNWVEV